jgi:hypothetical protein
MNSSDALHTIAIMLLIIGIVGAGVVIVFGYL